MSVTRILDVCTTCGRTTRPLYREGMEPFMYCDHCESAEEEERRKTILLGATDDAQALRKTQAYNVSLTKSVMALIETSRQMGAPNLPTLIAACELAIKNAVAAALMTV